MALRCFVDELSDTSALKPILAQLMDSIFKLMSEVGVNTPTCLLVQLVMEPCAHCIMGITLIIN